MMIERDNRKCRNCGDKRKTKGGNGKLVCVMCGYAAKEELSMKPKLNMDAVNYLLQKSKEEENV